jgi:hypothetical protein
MSVGTSAIAGKWQVAGCDRVGAFDPLLPFNLLRCPPASGRSPVQRSYAYLQPAGVVHGRSLGRREADAWRSTGLSPHSSGNAIGEQSRVTA